MGKLELSFACWDYDRTRAIQNSQIDIDGIDLNCLTLPVEETFFRMIRQREFDVSEMSLSSYTMSVARGDSPFIAIPVFPSRAFRHSCIYTNAASGIQEPKDLIGKRVGVPEFQMSAAVWIRGILAEYYGVPADSVSYYTGGEEEPGRIEKQQIDLASNITVHPIGPTQTLCEMLLEGEIDALHTARMPSAFVNGNGRVERLFPNYVEVEQAYFRETGLFPIMHTVVIRRDIYERNRWVPQSLLKAFHQAQEKVYDDLYETAALKAMLPWLTAHVEETRSVMGSRFWPYGLEDNRDVLAAFLRYHHEQGLSKRLLAPEELFAPESLESFKI